MLPLLFEPLLKSVVKLLLILMIHLKLLILVSRLARSSRAKLRYCEVIFLINAFLGLVLKLIFWIVSVFATVITAPILALLDGVFPNFSDYVLSFEVYLNDYVLRGLAFAREVFLNTTGYPRGLFHIIVNLYLAKLAIHYASIPIKFLINSYKTIKAGGEMVE